MDDAALHFLPLGGTGEIGMNLNLYAHDGRWLMVDCGVTFERSRDPGGRVQMADPRFIADRRDQLDGLILTHAHMDHLGAVADLWPVLRCPVYCTPFASFMLRDRLRELKLHRKVPLKVMRPGASVDIGPFSIQFVPITHSTLECNGLVIRAGRTTVFHTGDWKLDPEPLVGERTDEKRLRSLADLPIHALIGDSTNATREGTTPSEAVARDALLRLVKAQTKRVVVTCFASNVARVATLCRVAEQCGRHPILVGRSLERVMGAARRAKYLRDLPRVVPARDAGWLPREATLVIATGSQGEPRASLSRMATNSYRDVLLENGDTVIFSSKVIPGNELPIQRLKTQLRELGCAVFDEFTDPDVHVSGHPCRDDLRRMYGLVRPKWVIPTHGTPRHLAAHAELAADLPGVGALQCLNGQIVRVGPGPPRIVGAAPVGRLERNESEGTLVRVPAPSPPPRRRGPAKG
ncbi:MAG: ribonuclease J [Myxococcota bacterium]|jgi:ribonuclease J